MSIRRAVVSAAARCAAQDLGGYEYSGGQWSGRLDVSPDGKEIWAANARDSTVTVIDVASKKAVQTLPIAVKFANRLKFTPDGLHVLISALGAGSGDTSLLVMDAAARKGVKRLKLGGGAAGILMAPDGSRAFCGG